MPRVCWASQGGWWSGYLSEFAVPGAAELTGVPLVGEDVEKSVGLGRTPGRQWCGGRFVW